MCGIVGGIAERNLVPILFAGLKRLEYRGYDSAGIAVIDEHGQIDRVRALGKVDQLQPGISAKGLHGHLGIAHTRWATHGQPAEINAHPHICNHRVALVHNGIIENHQQLRERQQGEFIFTSETDTEVVSHQITHYFPPGGDLLEAVRQTLQDLEGTYAFGVMAAEDPSRLIAARKGSPLVVGLGIGENFIASDPAALLLVTQRFMYLEDGDLADIRLDQVRIYDRFGQPVERPVVVPYLSQESTDKGPYRHFMHKEIYEQPQAVIETLEGRVTQNRILVESFGPAASDILLRSRQLQIVACGTSYHAGLVARYWFEDILGLPCQVEVASEYRYRNPVITPDTLFLTLSQSGETADTLAALRGFKQHCQALELPSHSMTICNVPESSLIRESELTFMTHAGPEIGVASTKAFTTQLVALALLLGAIGKLQGRLDTDQESRIVKGLLQLPSLIRRVLKRDPAIEKMATAIAEKNHALFLGRGTLYPIAMEGALKLKEISYIHAEAYPAGELKHGPLALVDESMPVVAVAPKDDLLHKLHSNLQEVRARGGELFVFADHKADIPSDPKIHPLPIGKTAGRITTPIIYNIPLQLLAYHVAVIRGTDVDQPRNLAKSVTVE